jgi:hypothetical protein
VANLDAYHEPLPDNPHHGVIWGLVEMRRIDEEQYERAIDAGASEHDRPGQRLT